MYAINPAFYKNDWPSSKPICSYYLSFFSYPNTSKEIFSQVSMISKGFQAHISD